VYCEIITSEYLVIKRVNMEISERCVAILSAIFDDEEQDGEI